MSNKANELLGFSCFPDSFLWTYDDDGSIVVYDPSDTGPFMVSVEILPEEIEEEE